MKNELMPDFFESLEDDIYDFDNTELSTGNNQTPTPEDNYLDLSRAMTKTELAERIGISTRTLRLWLKEIDAESIPGYRKRGKIIVPGVLRVLAERFCL